MIDPICTCAATELQKCPVHRVCLVCGHSPCPCCLDWCDTVITDGYFKEREQWAVDLMIKQGANPDDEDDYPFLCCDGECVYEKSSDLPESSTLKTE